MPCLTFSPVADELGRPENSLVDRVVRILVDRPAGIDVRKAGIGLGGGVEPAQLGRQGRVGHAGAGAILVRLGHLLDELLGAGDLAGRAIGLDKQALQVGVVWEDVRGRLEHGGGLDGLVGVHQRAGVLGSHLGGDIRRQFLGRLGGPDVLEERDGFVGQADLVEAHPNSPGGVPGPRAGAEGPQFQRQRGLRIVRIVDLSPDADGGRVVRIERDGLVGGLGGVSGPGLAQQQVGEHRVGIGAYGRVEVFSLGDGAEHGVALGDVLKAPQSEPSTIAAEPRNRPAVSGGRLQGPGFPHSGPPGRSRYRPGVCRRASRPDSGGARSA